MALARVRVTLAPFKRAFRDDEQARVPWWLVALLIAVCVAGGMLRIGFTMSFDSVWAEDGTVFLGTAMKDGLAESILQPYAGYGHIVPRFLAALASAAPMWAIAATLSLGPQPFADCSPFWSSGQLPASSLLPGYGSRWHSLWLCNQSLARFCFQLPTCSGTSYSHPLSRCYGPPRLRQRSLPARVSAS